MRVRSQWRVLGALLLLTTLAACSGPEPEEPPVTPEARTLEQYALGEPADAAAATRTIEVGMLDTLRFDPEQLSVTAGETVTFIVHNGGQIDHDFVLGDQEYHDAIEHEGHGEIPNGVDAGPGETIELTWRFTRAGSILFACHEPGHYQGGMVGTLTVEG